MKTSESRTPTVVSQIDTSALEGVMGYNARRASLVLVGAYMKAMAAYQLGPVDYSILILITYNPGITSRQLCATLSIQPPNLVGMLNSFEKRGLVWRQPHPDDGRAHGLYLTESGSQLMQEIEPAATAMDEQAIAGLSASERKTLKRLLQKIYL